MAKHVARESRSPQPRTSLVSLVIQDEPAASSLGRPAAAFPGTGLTSTALKGAVIALLLATAGTAVPASANGLYENRSWQFMSTADRANKAIVADLIERKKGGFFDSFGPPRVTNNIFDMDCFIAADATGNAAKGSADATTSSPTTSPGSDLVADSTGNEALNAGGGGGPLNSDQTNTGNQQASVSDNTASVGDVDASGGTTTQILNNDQENWGDQHAKVIDSNACTVLTGSGGASVTMN